MNEPALGSGLTVGACISPASTGFISDNDDPRYPTGVNRFDAVSELISTINQFGHHYCKCFA